MQMQHSKAFATRLPEREADAITEAIEETDSTTSEFLRRAVRYYAKQNPDDILALCEDGSIEQMMLELGT
jgi:hypothetical protein